MKKSIMILSFMLSFVMLCCIFTTKGSNKLVRASSKTINNNQTIIVVGKGEVEVEPDTIQINFGLKTRADSLQSGQEKIKESFDNVVSKLKQVDDKANIYVYYSASYPVSDGGLLSYEFDYGLTAKSSKIDSANDIVNTIISAGATSVHNTSYTLTNKEETYVQALVKAKDNADQKVKAMYKDAVLVGLREENCYSCCESSRGEKIKVCAKVKAFYEVGSLSENYSQTSTKNDVKNQSNTTTTNTNKLTENAVEKQTENIEKTNKNKTEKVEEKQNNLSDINTQEKLGNNSVSQTTNTKNTVAQNDQNYNKTKDIKTYEEIKNNNENNLENNTKNNLEKNEEKLNNNNTTANTFNQEKTDVVEVKAENKLNENKTQKSNKINADNLIVKADKTLARNDDISLYEEYKEIA